jgi:glutamine synthetase
MNFAERCGIASPERAQQVARVIRRIADEGIEQLRFSWCDQHGSLRGKTLMAAHAARALVEGVGMVGTLMLKDTSDRTAYKVFEPDGLSDLPGFAGAANLLLLADPASFRVLPWADRTASLLCQPWFPDGQPVLIDTRRVLQQALATLADAGYGLRCGLEVEFHIYRLDDTSAGLDPNRAAWPGAAPQVSMIHPGYNLLSESWADMAHAPLRIVRETAQSLGLPLISLEVELGPSQVEAVFDATDALTAADDMVRFRNGVTQALRRAGYHATFMCRPPFPDIMSSGWHLHQSLVHLGDGRNAFMRQSAKPGTTPMDAQSVLSPVGEHYLAGLLAHAGAMSVLCTPTINGYGRFQPNALAPIAPLWGRDNRGAMLRVIGSAPFGPPDAQPDSATRIENRLGEPCANPYLYIASQIHAGLDGIRRQLSAPPATDRPYGDHQARLPTNLDDALRALRDDAVMVEALGATLVRYLDTLKRQELARYAQAQDPREWELREYFARF